MTRRTDLALRAMRLLADTHQVMKGQRLAAGIGTTTAFLVHVVHPLARGGWVHSQPGPRGGYQITDRGRQATVLELVEAVEGPVRTDQCVLQPRPCPGTEQCALHAAWLPARDALLEQLATTPVLDPHNHAGGAHHG